MNPNIPFHSGNLICSNFLTIEHNIPNIFNSQTNFIQNEINNNNIIKEENANVNANINVLKKEENEKEENTSHLFDINNITNDIDKIIKNTLFNENIENMDYNFHISDDSVSVRLGNNNGSVNKDVEVIKNIIAYLYHKQLSMGNESNGQVGEFIIQSYSSMPIQTTYIEEDEKFDYFANCKLINKLIGKAEKIKKDDSLLLNDEVCFICFDKYQEKELKRKLPHCNHCFHKKCIDKWLKNKSTCPHCRCDLMEHINLTHEDREEYYKKTSSCDDEENDVSEVEFIQFNLGIIGICNNNNQENENENNNENDK